MSLETDGVWRSGVWATTVWADGVWREGEAPVVSTTTKGGIGLPLIVKPIKRHKKLDTFREELDRLIFGVQEVAQEATQESQPVIEKAAQEIDVIAERFNIVQTFDDQAVITNQMELLRQDFEEVSKLIQSIIARNKDRRTQQLIAQEEELLLILAAEVF